MRETEEDASHLKTSPALKTTPFTAGPFAAGHLFRIWIEPTSARSCVSLEVVSVCRYRLPMLIVRNSSFSSLWMTCSVACDRQI